MKVLFVVVALKNVPPEITSDDLTAGVAPRQLGQGLRDIGVQVDYLPVAGTYSRMNYLRACFAMFRLWLTGGLKSYDLIHAHYGFNGVVARCQFAKPVIISFMGSDIYRMWERRLSWLLARIVNGNHVPGAQMNPLISYECEVIPYPTMVDIFVPTDHQEARRALGLDDDKKYVLFPYNPERVYHKRPDVIQAAVDQIPGAVMLPVFGKPPQLVAQYMNACDVMAMASMYEGSPVAIREALAVNLPVVSVDVADVKVHLDQVPGCYVCERDPDDMAEKLRAAFADGQRLKTGRDYALQFAPATIARKYLAFYQRVLKNTGDHFVQPA